MGVDMVIVSAYICDMNLLHTESFRAPAPPLAAHQFGACDKCAGTGRFATRSGRDIGACFACAGSGKVKPEAAGIAVSDEALRATFDKLVASGLRRVKLRMQGFEVKPAKATGKNPGALYVTEGETYLGKIINGRFDSASVCSAETAEKVAALVADPLASIKASGLCTGNCAVCGLELTDPISVRIGIGPRCLERLGGA